MIETMYNSGNMAVNVVDGDMYYPMGEDIYDMLEALKGGDFEHIKCHYYTIFVIKYNIVVVLFITE